MNKYLESTHSSPVGGFFVWGIIKRNLQKGCFGIDINKFICCE